jgi:GNAT superfamily N-acetyltransferase
MLPMGAEALDPAFGRERGRATLEQAAQRGEHRGPTDPTTAGFFARLPDVRQQLPETFAPVDVFGRPRYETPQVLNQGQLMRGLSRTVFPSRESAAPPAMNQLDPLMAQLAELGITPGPPSARVTLPGTDLPLQHTAESAAATQRVGGIPAQITAHIVAQIMSRPQMQVLPDAQRNLIARQLMDQIRERVRRALGSARLSTALASGAQLPSLLRQV